jgi:hypothetical protein
MTKILVWAIVIFVVLMVLRLVNIAKAKGRSASTRGSGKPPPAQPMVRCVRCGVYLPRADAKQTSSGFLCGEPACRDPR